MKKNLFILGAIVLSNFAFPQTGINTQNPLATFHVDGGKDNPNTGIPNATQVANDFVVTSQGNVGLGTITPTEKLHVEGAVKIVDGTQSNNNVLTSDADGKGSWKPLPDSNKNVILGSLNSIRKTVTNNLAIGSSITLPAGKWLIYLGQLVKTEGSPATATNNLWMRISLSSNSSSFSTSGFSFLGSSSVAGSLTMSSFSGSGAPGFNVLTGVMPISTNQDITLYPFFTINDPAVGGTPPAVFIGGNAENYIFAVPMN